MVHFHSFNFSCQFLYALLPLFHFGKTKTMLLGDQVYEGATKPMSKVSEQFFKELSKAQRNQQVIRNYLITLYAQSSEQYKEGDVKGESLFQHHHAIQCQRYTDNKPYKPKQRTVSSTMSSSESVQLMSVRLLQTLYFQEEQHTVVRQAPTMMRILSSVWGICLKVII